VGVEWCRTAFPDGYVDTTIWSIATGPLGTSRNAAGAIASARENGQSAFVSDDGAARKRRAVRLFQRYVLNPPTLLAVRMGLVRGHVLVETVGRRTGKSRRTVVGMHFEGSTGWVVAEQGSHAGYVRNLEANPRVRVCVKGKWRPAHAQVVPDDDSDKRLDGFGRPRHAANVRRFGTDLRTVRFDFAGT
jgi:deazaflavin-dependent oxidoreductase (nitroreductase family)